MSKLFVRGLHTRTAVARHPCFSWAFLSPWMDYHYTGNRLSRAHSS